MKSAFHRRKCMICGQFYVAQRASQPGDFTLVVVVLLELHPEKFSPWTMTNTRVRRYFEDQANFQVHNFNEEARAELPVDVTWIDQVQMPHRASNLYNTCLNISWIQLTISHHRKHLDLNVDMALSFNFCLRIWSVRGQNPIIKELHD